MSDDLKILLLAPFGKNGGINEYSRAIAKEFEELGITVIRISTQVSGKRVVKAIKQPFYIALQLIKIRKEYDIISVQLSSYWGFMPGIIGTSIGKMLGKNVISTYHGGAYKKFISDHPYIFNYVIRRSKVFIVASHSMKEWIGKKFFKYKYKIETTLNGYDHEIFRPMDPYACRKKLGIPKNEIVILSIGGLYPVKGHKHLIDAMKIVNDIKPKVFCYIIGAGPEYASLIKQINYLNLNSTVKLTGRKTHETIPVWINACDIFVLPSLNEGNPTVMFEALACGKPFIGTHVGGVPEIISDSHLGILVPPRDSLALAEAISLAIDKKWNNEYIYEYAKQFSFKNISKKILSIYKNIK